MKKTKIILITLLTILLLSACGAKKSNENVTEPISQAASEISKETTADGKTITTLSDGTIIEKASDGSTIEKASDGTIKEVQANGTVIETAKDGTITETKIDGTVILAKTDGSKTETAPDGITKELQAATEAPVVTPDPVVVAPTEAPTAAPIVEAPTEAPAVAPDPIVVAPTEAPTSAPIVEAPTQAPTQAPYVLTSAETFLKQVAWSGINMNTSQNVFDKLCIIGDDFANGKYTEAQAIEQIKLIKDSIQPEWWIFESYAKTFTAPGKLDCSTMALKQNLIAQLNENITMMTGDNQYARVLYNPNTDTTIIFYISVSGTTVHN